MTTLRGIPVSGGIATGPAVILRSARVEVPERTVPVRDVDREIRRLERAVAATREDVETLKRETESRLGASSAIIETFLTFLADEHVRIPIEQAIRRHRWAAETAVARVLSGFAEQLRALHDATLAARAADVLDIEQRLVGHLLGRRSGRAETLDRPAIIVADDLTPTEAAALDREKVLAIATDGGGTTSHTAILARALRIPAVVGLVRVSTAARAGEPLIVDGDTGEVLLEPGREALEDVERRRRESRKAAVRLRREKSLPSETADGIPVDVQGNIETHDDAAEVAALGGAGVGLFRSEFLFLGREDLPDEEVQFRSYRTAATALRGRPVTLRTMDFGADKFEARLQSVREENPALGARAIRLSLRNPAPLRVQLRAALRAAHGSSLRIMFPMVLDVAEFRAARRLVDEAAQRLRRAGISHEPRPPVGAMIEIPAAALGAAALAREADFLSIGSNDLTQYTLAVDRTNPAVQDLWAPHHPSVLRLIRMVIDAGRAAGKSVSLCGEMAASDAQVPLLLGLGLRTFSVAPAAIPRVRRVIRAFRIAACEALADRALNAATAADVEEILGEFAPPAPPA